MSKNKKIKISLILPYKKRSVGLMGWVRLVKPTGLTDDHRNLTPDPYRGVTKKDIKKILKLKSE